MSKKLLILLLLSLTLAAGCTEHAYYTQFFYQKDEKEKFSPPPADMKGKILWHGNRSLPEIALTFDDGPNAKNTPKVLDILKQYDVKATFFVLGKFAEKNGGILSREAAEGHNIGNHTYSHVKGTMTDIKMIQEELRKTDRLIARYSGSKVKYFRPPFGFENWRFLTEAEFMDYTVVLWTLDVADWDHTKKENYMVSKILKATRNGSIILLHDGGSSREAVIDALPKIIKGLKRKGYQFVTIDEMIAHL
jgi:peptidoglycan/xylan/chitin deacetylase (PgdA/CDA1 family)